MSKVLVILVVVLGLVLVRYGLKNGFELPSFGSTVSEEEMASRGWTDKVTLANRVEVSVPFALRSTKLELPPEVASMIDKATNYSKEDQGVHVFASSMTYKPEATLDLDGAADGSIASMKAVPGTSKVDSETHESLILAKRALELEATIHRGEDTLEFHGLLFQRGQTLYQLMLIAPVDGEDTLETWRRIRDSVRLAEGVEGATEAVGSIVPGGVALPPGMEKGGEVGAPKNPAPVEQP